MRGERVNHERERGRGTERERGTWERVSCERERESVRDRGHARVRCVCGRE